MSDPTSPPRRGPFTVLGIASAVLVGVGGFAVVPRLAQGAAGARASVRSTRSDQVTTSTAAPTSTSTSTTVAPTTTTTSTTSTTTTSAPKPTTTTTIETAEPADLCTSVSDALRRFERGSFTDAASVVSLVETVADELWDASAARDDDVERQVADMALLLDHHAALVTALLEEQRSADDADRAAIDRVVRTIGPALQTLVHDDSLREIVPELADACKLHSPGVLTPADWILFARSVQAFVHGATSELSLADDLWLALSYSIEFDATMGDLSLSGVTVEHLEQCLADANAAEFGDNPGCDTYLGACVGGDGDACNDLFWISPEGSDYEALAASCANRVKFSDPQYAGACEDVQP